MSDVSRVEFDYEIHRIRIESLGQIINNENKSRFERILNAGSLSGVYNITGWTSEAIRVLLEVCSHTNQRVTLKHGNRYFMPIKYPMGPMLETFVETIISNSY